MVKYNPWYISSFTRTNGQFPLLEAPAGNHGTSSCIHQNKYPVRDDEHNYMHHEILASISPRGNWPVKYQLVPWQNLTTTFQNTTGDSYGGGTVHNKVQTDCENWFVINTCVHCDYAGWLKIC